MKELTSCYANWRIDIILLLGAAALLLVSGESETAVTRLAGAALLIADIIIARRWRKAGRLPELDKITE